MICNMVFGVLSMALFSPASQYVKDFFFQFKAELQKFIFKRSVMQHFQSAFFQCTHTCQVIATQYSEVFVRTVQIYHRRGVIRKFS
jgi:hypothetical protein